MDSDNVAFYAVYIEYTLIDFTRSNGSGIIVKPSSNKDIFYIFTAKHTFLKEEEKEQNKNLNKGEPNIDKIEVKYFFNQYGKLDSKGRYFDVKEVIEILDVDIVILVIHAVGRKNEYDINDFKCIKSLSILDNSFKSCCIVGYPNIRKQGDQLIGENEFYQCKYEQTSINKTYEVQVQGKLLSTYEFDEKENIKGLSGSGVLVDIESNIYLTGIQIEIREPINFLCIDLREIGEYINDKLKAQNYPIIDIETFICQTLKGVDLSDIDFNKIQQDLGLETLNNQKIQSLKKLSLDEQFEEIKELPRLKDEENEIESKTRKLADIYLYRGIICHNKEDNRRANKNFNKAIEYNPKYEVYFLHAKNLRKQNKKNAKDLDSTNYSPLTNEGRQVIRLLEEQLQLKSSFETLKQNCLNLLAMYYQQDRKGENPEINDAKAKIFFTLGALYYKHKKYNDSKNALLGSINLLEKDTTQNKSLIRCYRKLVNTFCKQEKYEEAKEYCLKIVENSESTEKNKFEVYTGLLSISYFLKEDEEQINKYYQKANKCLNAIIKQDKSTNHERLTNHLKKTWLATQKNIVNKDLKVQNSMQQGILSLEKSNNDLKIQLKDFEDRMEVVTDSIKDNKAEIENYVEYKTQEITQKLNDIKNILNKFSPSSFDLLRKFFKWIKEKIFKVKS